MDYCWRIFLQCTGELANHPLQYYVDYSWRTFLQCAGENRANQSYFIMWATPGEYLYSALWRIKLTNPPLLCGLLLENILQCAGENRANQSYFIMWATPGEYLYSALVRIELTNPPLLCGLLHENIFTVRW